MYIIAGLGNPEKKYDHTRHNAGFLAAKKLHEKYLPGRERSKFDARILRGRIEGEDVLLMRPMTYMNNSGLAVRKAVDFYHVPADHVIIIYDDIAIPLGTLRIRKSGSAGGHNGMKSIIEHLGTQDFPRIRIGVGSNRGEDLIDYVLGAFSKEEAAVIDEAAERAADAAVSILKSGLDLAMNRYNQKQVVRDEGNL